MGGGEKDTDFDKEREGREEDGEGELTEEARREGFGGKIKENGAKLR